MSSLTFQHSTILSSFLFISTTRLPCLISLPSLIKQATVNSIPRADLFSTSYTGQVQASAMSVFRPNSLLSAQFSRAHQRDGHAVTMECEGIGLHSENDGNLKRRL
ncbi:hypothetical protein ARMGADRAFT_179080 [Armillaria gallica]|uniref:Uncharacterized protein n=1 Tax=Armillaria gallica TaxID=47427 RepID=A0A2H3DKZ0_ARMGA|nr:hypothetical protein ARMGADRAFT_179080 [Armillaria gallica]